jgi:hypothetical protein
VVATPLLASVGDANYFKNGRLMAVWIGLWVYDEEGNQNGYHRPYNLLLKRTFNYAYNKIVLGGNYQCVGNTVCQGETRWYFDDFIVDSERIGPTYFVLVDNNF